MKSICVFCASSNAVDKVYHQTATELGHQIGQLGFDLIYGGGGIGLMGAVARGVHDKGGRVVGVIPEFFLNKKKAIEYNEADELIVVLEGVLEVRINDEIHQVGPDHTIVVPPNVPHGFTIVGDSDARILGFFPIQDPFHHTHYLKGGPANQNDEQTPTNQ